MIFKRTALPMSVVPKLSAKLLLQKRKKKNLQKIPRGQLYKG